MQFFMKIYVGLSLLFMHDVYASSYDNISSIPTPICDEVLLYKKYAQNKFSTNSIDKSIIDNDRFIATATSLLYTLDQHIPSMRRECQSKERAFYGKNLQAIDLARDMHRLDLACEAQAFHDHVQSLEVVQELNHNELINFLEKHKQNIEIAKLQHRVCEKTRCFADVAELVQKKRCIPGQDYKVLNKYLAQQEVLTKHGLQADLDFYIVEEYKQHSPRMSMHQRYPHPSKDGLSRYTPSARAIVPAIMSGKIKIQK